MTELSCYVHDPIQPEQLRLGRFLQDGDNLSAVLEIFSATDSLPRYYALSYTWALGETGPTKNWTIQIGGHQLPVLDSLQPFFHALKLRGTALHGTWW